MEVKLEPELSSLLEELGRSRGQPPSQLVEEAVRLYLEIQSGEDKARQVTLERWQRFERTGAHVDGEKVEEWVESWGNDEDRQCPGPDD